MILPSLYSIESVTLRFRKFVTSLANLTTLALNAFSSFTIRPAVITLLIHSSVNSSVTEEKLHELRLHFVNMLTRRVLPALSARRPSALRFVPLARR
ncbi:MAG: hypothetical protein ACEY26_00815 [Candidatus Hodgkinia cicadicola]